VLGGLLLVNVTSLAELQLPLVIVQRKVTDVPAVTPVTVDVGDVGAVIVAEPVIIVHRPVPGVGVFPASVKVLLLHCVWLSPAIDVAGGVELDSITSSKLAVQGLLLIVQRKVALVPTGTPVTVDVGDEASVIVAVPDSTVHVPVPEVAVLPASVKDPLLHFS
jgi:hypothetical protein